MTLTLTETASTVVKSIAARSAASEAGGLRISGSDATSAEFNVAIVAAGLPEDILVESDGARVFLDETAAVALSDTILDAEVEEDGSIRFAIG